MLLFRCFSASPRDLKKTMLLLKILCACILAAATAASPVARTNDSGPHISKRWSTLKCYSNNYKHTASWGYLMGIFKRIDDACNTMIGSGEYKWLEKGQAGSFYTTFAVPPGSQATHAMVSFSAAKGGTPLHKTHCRESLKYIQEACAQGTSEARFTHGGSVQSDDGNIIAVLSYFPECCFFGWDHENDSLTPGDGNGKSATAE
ncbi:hypothetical protein FN846DRAFT_955464, partial [Sphaerosporella brunnea]